MSRIISETNEALLEREDLEIEEKSSSNDFQRRYWQLQRESLIYGNNDLGLDYIQLPTSDEADFSQLTERELQRRISQRRTPQRRTPQRRALLPGSAPSVYKFSHEIKANDVLVSFDSRNNTVLVGVAKTSYLHSLVAGESKRAHFYHFLRVDWRIKKKLDLPPEIRKNHFVSTLSSIHWNLIQKTLLEKYPGDTELQNTLKLPEEKPLQSEEDEKLIIPDDFMVSQQAAERTKNIIFYGPPGTGKTWIVENFSTYLLLQKNASNRDANLYWNAVSSQTTVVRDESQTDEADGTSSSKEIIQREVRGPVNSDLGRITVWAIQPLHDRSHAHWANFFSTPQAENWDSAPQVFLEQAQNGDCILVHYKESASDYLGIAVVRTDSELAIINLAKIGSIPLPQQWDERLTNFQVVNFYGGANMYRLSEEQAQDVWRQFKKAGYSVGIAERVFIPAQNYYDIVTFHQSFSYEDFVEGLRPQAKENGQIEYVVKDGIFKRFSRKAERYWEELGDEAPQFVFVIDEVNRANIAKVFGELISLIEDDKRLGQENALSVTLPYSKEGFGIPPNLYIFGTMNTADRSLTLIDIALRRRFAFIEIAPDATKLGNVKDLSLSDLLTSINLRLRMILGNEYKIGHSYFFSLKNTDDVEGLHFVWNQYIIPLLQEYFYGDIQRLHALLGDDLMEKPPIEESVKQDLSAFYHNEESDYELKTLDADELLEALKKLAGESA